MVIAIFGASGQIGKCLNYYFRQKTDHTLLLFSRSENYLNYKSFQGADVIINCIGYGTYKEGYDYTKIFETSEYYDNMIIEYLKKESESVYINFSSGIVNKQDIAEDDYLTVMKQYVEAKHKSYKDLNIIDVRLYSFFSRWANLDDNYLLQSIVKAAMNKTEFVSCGDNLQRNYIHPEDLFDFINSILDIKCNRAYEVGASVHVFKSEIIGYFIKNYNIKVEYDNNFKSLTGDKIKYIPELIHNEPEYTSMETIIQESKYFES
jgi:dTDP-4-dehydrorhamnose reductase